MPKLTFLAPVYNKEAWIAESIESLQSQTEEDIEILFFDDGSTDDTKTIIRHYMVKDKRIRLISHEKNVGLGKTWNWGTTEVKSPIIAVASGDDIWSKDRAKLTIDGLKKADVFYGSFWNCDAQMRESEFKEAVPFDKKKFLTPRQDGYAAQYVGHFVLAYKTLVGLKTPYDANRKYGIDYPFVCDLVKAGYKFNWTKEVLGWARMLPSGVSHQHREEIVKADKEYEKKM